MELLLAAELVALLPRTHFWRIIRPTTIVMLAFSFVPLPLLVFHNYLSRSASDRFRVYHMNAALQPDFEMQGRIASNNNWSETLFLSYLTQNPYYGETPIQSARDVETIQEDFAIDYLIYWGPAPEFLSRYRELSSGRVSAFTIYALD
jgi:hypothetical protein